MGVNCTDLNAGEKEVLEFEETRTIYFLLDAFSFAKL